MKRKSAPSSERVTKLEKEIAALREQLQTAVADYRNLEARIDREVSHHKKDSLFRLVDKLLSVLDDLERAETHLKDKGLTMAVNQFRQVLASEGVKEVKTEGEEFDPETMDCVELCRGDKNVVAKTLLKGYILNGETVRPAKVKVGKGGK